MRTIRVSDLLMHDDLSIEELVKEFCEEGDFTLIDFEEYDDRYEEDGSQLAQVLIRVDDDPLPNPADVYNQRIEEIAKIVHSNSEESERLLKHEYPLDSDLGDCRDIKDKYKLSWNDLKNVWRKCHSYKLQNEAKSKYDKSNTKMVSLKLNRKTDADILAALEKEENVQGFIKSCIRKNIIIDDYLVERIEQMKNKKTKSSNKILYSTLYEKCDIRTYKQKERADDKLKTYLEHYKECGFIKGYKLEEDGIYIQY